MGFGLPIRNRAPNPLSPPRQTLGLSTPRPSRPNPHPTPLTPRTPRGEWTPRQRDGCWPARNAYSDRAGLHPSPWLFGQIGCRHFIKSLRIIYRLAHRTERREACGGHSGRARPLRRARPAPRDLGGCCRPPCPPALRGSLAVSAADARIYMFIGGGGRAVVARLFIGVYLAVRAVRVRPFHPRL